MKSNRKKGLSRQLTQYFPEKLIAATQTVERNRGSTFYISGGTVRDWLLDRTPADLDITVQNGAIECCKELLTLLQGGAFVLLGAEGEEAARLVWQGVNIDFSNFRKGVKSIEEELRYRDFTINAMAVELGQDDEVGLENIIDPLEGIKDLKNGLLSCCPDAFTDDPLRMLRGYRLRAELGFQMSSESVAQIRIHNSEMSRTAAERILYELDRIMSTSAAGHVFGEMAKSGVLWQIIPELEEGVGVEQPGYHHEDVFNHSVLALRCIDKVFDRPQDYFGNQKKVVIEYISDSSRRRDLRWSALFHDLGKPATRSSGTMTSDRVTFYNHDKVSKHIFENIAARLRMSNAVIAVVGKLVEMHMHPFHLNNARKGKQLSRKALLKICKKAGDELAGLFVLAMADSLAGQGELKPDDMEKQLASLFDEVQGVNETLIQPILCGERLLTGYELINEFELEPGPMFSQIFKDLEIAQVEEDVLTKEDAFEWLASYLKDEKETS